MKPISIRAPVASSIGHLPDYHVPVHMDVPKIDIIWNDIPDPHWPLGTCHIG
jgi:CO/xanthine dehydrogenase Mo-binding subunit